MKKNSIFKIFTDGIIANNPVFVTLLGICPTLAVTTSLIDGLGMGIATTFVLICSNITISLLKNIIPSQVRLPCYIVAIAGFVTFTDRMVAAFIPPLYSSLGLFLPLITVNCVVLSRAELFASKNNPALSAVDGLGTGIGFTLALVLMGSVREIFGSGTLLGDTDFAIAFPFLSENPIELFILPAGGFLVFGLLIAVITKLQKAPPREIGCEGCPSKNICTQKQNKNPQCEKGGVENTDK